MFLAIEPTIFYIIIAVVVAVLILASVIAIVIFKRKAPKSKFKVDEEFINNLITLYGGKNNIKEVTVDNARLKVVVDDLDIVNLQGLKENSEAGVFVTGNTIKTLFKIDSKLVKDSLERKL